MMNDKKMAKEMKKGIRKIVSLVPFPENMDAVQAFLRGYSADVKEMDANTCIHADKEERELNVSFFNGDLLSVMADATNKDEVMYTINFDSIDSKGFYLSKEGSQPWVE